MVSGRLLSQNADAGTRNVGSLLLDDDRQKSIVVFQFVGVYLGRQLLGVWHTSQGVLSKINDATKFQIQTFSSHLNEFKQLKK